MASLLVEYFAADLLTGDDQQKYYQMLSAFHTGAAFGSLMWIRNGNLGSFNMYAVFDLISDLFLYVQAPFVFSGIGTPFLPLFLSLLGFGGLIGMGSLTSTIISEVKIGIVEFLLSFVAGFLIAFIQNKAIAQKKLVSLKRQTI